jgi:hypothetical protein
MGGDTALGSHDLGWFGHRCIITLFSGRKKMIERPVWAIDLTAPTY